MLTLPIEHVGQGRDVYACRWLNCNRRNQKQASRHSLITHLRAHTGEKPYTCTQPGPSDDIIHLERLHADLSGCGRSFTRSDAMAKHLRSLHNVALEPGYQRAKRAAALKEAKAAEEDMQGGAESTVAGGDHESAAAPISDSEQAESARAPAQPQHPPRPVNAVVKPRKLAPAPRRRSASPPIEIASDNELMQDPEIANVLPTIRGRAGMQFWVPSNDDLAAVKIIRDTYPRKGRSKRKRAGSGSRGDPMQVDGESGDSFDEGAGDNFVDDPGPMGNIQDPTTGETLSVLDRSRWQVKYITAKVKLMLVEEENNMRKEDLRIAIQDAVEAGLRV